MIACSVQLLPLPLFLPLGAISKTEASHIVRAIYIFLVFWSDFVLKSLVWHILICKVLFTVTFTVLVPCNAAPHNRYQPHPAEAAQHNTCSNIRLVLLKMGIMMPETCWEIVKNKHLTVASCWFSLSLHNFLFVYSWECASWIKFSNCQKDATVFSLIHFCRQLYMFRVLTPIIRSSYSCNYSFWHWSTGSDTVSSRCWVGIQF